MRKQYAEIDRKIFWMRLKEYKKALETGEGFLIASLNIYSALGAVPKYYRRYVNQAFNNTKKADKK